MDFLLRCPASFYNQPIKYKHQVNDEKEIVAELKECAEVIASTDWHMQSIRRKIEANHHEATEDEVLFAKMRKIDMPIE